MTTTGDCGIPELADNTVPVLNSPHNIGDSIRIQCAEGYVRKAGTSNLIRCTQQQNGNPTWHSDLPLKCIPDPKKPHVPTKETERPHQQFTSSTTERTARTHPTLHGTSSATTATGYITLTTTNEVVTTKSRRTTSQPTLMSTTKETESITTTNETTTSYTSREYMTTTSPHTLSGSFTTTTGVNASVRTSNNSEGVPFFSKGYTSTIGGVTGIILLCLVAAVFISLWLRHRNHRSQIVYHPKPDPYASYIPVSASEHSSAQSNNAAENSTEGSVIDKNPGIPHGADCCDKLLTQTDS